MDRLEFSPKQKKAISMPPARWNIHCGATRSGKTFLTYFIIPKRLKELPEGRRVLIGKTISTLEYNVLTPMRELFGEEHVSQMKINAAGLRYVLIFGKEFRCVGANDKRAVTKIQGSGLIYAYGDEVATWDRSIFDMLKSRLDSAHACFDGTTNPDAPNHWLKQFIDESVERGVSLNLFEYTIDDNIALDPEFVANLKKEYAGTVYYDRFILGRWVAAEGSIYVTFIADKEKYIIDELPEGSKGFISIGVDFGGNKSGQAFNATLIDYANGRIITLMDYWKDGKFTTRQLEAEFVKFVQKVRKTYPQFNIVDIRADSAEQVLIGGLQSALLDAGLGMKIKNSIKGEINDRIRFYTSMFGYVSYHIMREAKNTIGAFEGAVWRELLGMQDERLDDGTSNIDTLDAQEYSTEPYAENMLKIVRYGRKAA